MNISLHKYPFLKALDDTEKQYNDISSLGALDIKQDDRLESVRGGRGEGRIWILLLGLLEAGSPESCSLCLVSWFLSPEEPWSEACW